MRPGGGKQAQSARGDPCVVWASRSSCPHCQSLVANLLDHIPKRLEIHALGVVGAEGDPCAFMPDHLSGLRLRHSGVLQAPEGTAEETVEIDAVPPAFVLANRLELRAVGTESSTCTSRACLKATFGSFVRPRTSPVDSSLLASKIPLQLQPTGR